MIVKTFEEIKRALLCVIERTEKKVVLWHAIKCLISTF